MRASCGFLCRSDALVGVNLTALRESFGPNHRDDVKRLIAMDGVKVRTSACRRVVQAP